MSRPWVRGGLRAPSRTMTHDSHTPGPINRPASNARQTGAGELARSTRRTAGGGEDFLGLNADLAAHGASEMSATNTSSAPARPSVTPGESWLFDAPEESAPVASAPTPEPTTSKVEPSPILNTSWSESSSRLRGTRWVTPLLVTATVAAIGLVGYPALDRATDGPPASEARLQRAAKVASTASTEVAVPPARVPSQDVSPLTVVERTAAPTTVELSAPRELEVRATPETSTPSVPLESTASTNSAESDPFEVIDPVAAPSGPLVRTTDIAPSASHALESKPQLETTAEMTAEVSNEPLEPEPLVPTPAVENVPKNASTSSAPSATAAASSEAPAEPSAEVLARREARAELRARRKARVEEVRAAALAAEVEAMSMPTTPEPVATTPEPVATTPEPVATTPEPVATTPEPVVTTPEPVVTTPEPVVTTPEPVVTTPAAVVALETLPEGVLGAPALLEWLEPGQLCGPSWVEGESEGELVSDPATWSGAPRVTKLDVQSLLLMSRPVGKNTAQRPGVWNETRVPLEEISRATRLATPRIGRVRVTLLSGELFEGRLNAVGEGCVWIDTSYGRMGLNGTLVKSVERLDVAEEGTAGVRRVRVNAPGGMLTGTLESDDGANASILLDSGARMTVPSSDVSPLGESPKDTVRVKRKP